MKSPLSSSSALKLALILSLTLTIPTATTALFPNPTASKRKLAATAATAAVKPTATTADLLHLLGPPNQASAVNPGVAAELSSCFKFLVPTRPIFSRRFLKEGRDVEDEMVWWPPEPVLEIARLAVDSGGDPGAIQRALDPTMITVPDVEESNEDRCELTRTPYGRRFINKELNSYIEFLFNIIVARGANVGLHVSLNRYDFFHGHLFLATGSGRLGILFHAKEYPAYDKDVFPYNMGFCQIGSNVTYDDSMNLRNILWLAPLPSNSTKAWLAPGLLVVLDARPDGIIYRDLIPDYVQYARTLYEEDFGDVVVDVNYLNVGHSKPDYQLFLC